jgi:hypothetical protein
VHSGQNDFAGPLLVKFTNTLGEVANWNAAALASREWNHAVRAEAVAPVLNLEKRTSVSQLDTATGFEIVLAEDVRAKNLCFQLASKMLVEKIFEKAFVRIRDDEVGTR